MSTTNEMHVYRAVLDIYYDMASLLYDMADGAICDDVDLFFFRKGSDARFFVEIISNIFIHCKWFCFHHLKEEFVKKSVIREKSPA